MKLYAIEGTDGSGKKTQIKKLYDYLKYILEELPNYVDGSKNEIPSKLLPWSEEEWTDTFPDT